MVRVFFFTKPLLGMTDQNRLNVTTITNEVSLERPRHMEHNSERIK